jgi:RecJ-like exonuclease
MTHWYPYRWVCDSCLAVHYFDATERGCCRCGKHGMTQQVNNPKLVAEQERRQGEKPAKRKAPPPAVERPPEVEVEEEVEIPDAAVAAAPDSLDASYTDCDADEYVADVLRQLLE